MADHPSNTPSLRDRDAHVIADIGRLRFNPLAVKGGRGCTLIEDGGREILDLSGCAGSASLGYSHPAVVDAAGRALSDMAGSSLLLYPNPPAIDLAEKLLEVTPGAGERRVWFGHSGSDANDCAVRVARAATGRQRFISFIGSYHGNVSGSMAVSGHTAMTHTLPQAGLVLLPYPDPYRPRFTAEAVLDLLDYQFATTCPPDQVAAVFIEPLMSDGGLIVPPPGFLAALAERCQRYGILVVVDEVKVGMGRSGLLHCFQHEGLEPDMVVFGKGLGGGLPLSAVVGPARLMDHSGAFALQTTAGNPVATAAGNAVLDTIRSERLEAHAARLGAAFADGLCALADTHEIIGDVRGRGLAIGVELVKDRATRTPAPAEVTAKIIYRAWELGVALSYVGLSANVLEFTPPLILTEAEMRTGLSVIDQAMTDVVAGKVSDDAVAPFMMW